MNVWVAFVKEVREKNPLLSWKECLLLAQPLYKKRNRTKSKTQKIALTKEKNKADELNGVVDR